MTKFSSTSKSLIGVSVILTLMVLWLGSRQISDAITQLAGANQLSQSVVSEATLFKLANNLDRERAAIQRNLAGSVQYANKSKYLNKLAKNTQVSYEQARDQILQSYNKRFQKLQYRYDESNIAQTLDEIETTLDQLNFSRVILKGQISLANVQRDEAVRMQLYDNYTNAIATINKLRKQTHAYPHESYIGVIAAHEIKDAIWNITNAVQQSSILIESFLLKYGNAGADKINIDNLNLRVFQQHDNAHNELKNISELLDSGNFNAQAKDALSSLKLSYENEFRKSIRRILLSLQTTEDHTQLLSQWRTITEKIEQKVSFAQTVVLKNTEIQADLIKQMALIRLIFNIFLVGLCMAAALAAYKIAKRIQHQADHDGLTKLPNRRYFKEALSQMLNRTDVARNEKLSLLTIDLNGFKTINDTLGHSVGDRLLKQVSARLKSEVEDNAFLARMGGDEFALSYPYQDNSKLELQVQRVKSVFDQSFTTNEGQVKVGVSIGYSVYPDDANDAEELQIKSDFAMFSAKQSDTTIQPYDRETAERLERRVLIERDLACAIDNDGLELHYQPQVDLNSMSANAVEALLRWHHPTRGMVSPVEFIGIAEETGQMPAIGKWVLYAACKRAAYWHQQDQWPIRVAINVSAHQIAESDFVNDVIEAATMYGLSPEFLELEITESVLISDVDKVIHRLKALKDYGFRIALDDFGTGYSSLSQLELLPIDTLKIDRSFIQKLDELTQGTNSITATIASMAQVLQLETVAEGIETESQLNEVKRLGIDTAQGYFYSKPVSADAVVDTLRQINMSLDSASKVA